MAPSAATKTAVAAMMKLPKQERIDRLVAMSTECIARQEDAAPFLELIQMELDTPDEPAAASRPSSGTAVADAAAQRAKTKAKRRALTAKRNELRAMLAKVDARERSLKPASEASRAAYAAAAPVAHGSEERGKVLSHPRAKELMRKVQTNPRLMRALEDVQRSGAGAMAKYSNDPDVMEVVNALQAIRQSMDGAPAAAAAAPSTAAASAAAPSAAAEPVGPMPTGLFLPGCAQSADARSPGKSPRAPPRGQTSLGGALGARTLGSHKGRASEARGDVDALLRKAEGGITGLGGGKASAGYSRARGSSGIFM